MDIQPIQITLKLSYNKLYDLAYDIKYSLRQSIVSHWNNLQQEQDGEGLFNERNKEKLQMMKKMFEVCGHAWCYLDSIREFEKLFAGKRKEREGKKSNG